ncbi:MAG: hypothetical protein HWD61_04045 [Parachlamydiaceae bacterium]|nr:MAG: hypothetical protein HWD61_04045 [Parachlamydiaceae bacterium]
MLLDWRPQNGIVFFTSLFAAVLAFNEEEFSQSFDSLEEETLFRVAAALFESRLTLRQSATMYNLLKAITAFRDLVNDDTWGKKIEDLTEEEKLKQTEKDQQIIKLLIDAGVPNLPDCTGLDAQFVDEDECTVNLDTIKEKKEEFFKELKDLS